MAGIAAGATTTAAVGIAAGTLGGAGDDARAWLAVSVASYALASSIVRWYAVPVSQQYCFARILIRVWYLLARMQLGLPSWLQRWQGKGGPPAVAGAQPARFPFLHSAHLYLLSPRQRR